MNFKSYVSRAEKVTLIKNYYKVRKYKALSGEAKKRGEGGALEQG